MKNWKLAGAVVHLFLLTAFSATAQVLPNVDIETARTQIEQFLSENEQFSEQITSLEATNEELAADIELWETWLSGIRNVTERVKDEANRLLDIVSDLASKSVVERAQTVLERYYRIKSILEEKEAELTDRIEAARTSIEKNLMVAEELREKIQSNLDNVELLKAAIERSAGSEETINAYIESLEKALDEAQRVINQSL